MLVCRHYPGNTATTRYNHALHAHSPFFPVSNLLSLFAVLLRFVVANGS